MSKVGIIFGSNKGDASKVAEYLASKIQADVIDAKGLESAFLSEHEKLIFVASTHKVGELQNDFKQKLDLLKECDFSGKTLALVGLGGLEKHSGEFCDGLVEFLPLIRGAKLVGAYAECDYNYKRSLAFINGKFIGLVLDINTDEAWQKRTDKWFDGIKAEFN